LKQLKLALIAQFDYYVLEKLGYILKLKALFLKNLQ